MANLFTKREVFKLCRAAGFGKRGARIASAIALCESASTKNGEPAADFDMIGDVELANRKWGYSYGGFQIRSLREQKGTGLHRDETRLLDPEFNAWAAKQVKKEQGWRAWSVYLNGAYKAYLPGMFPPPPNVYVVIGGDTLSKIGVKLGIPWTDIARWNNLHFPYTLYIGQNLVVSPPPGD